MACGNNMVLRSGLQSERAPLGHPSQGGGGGGAARHQAAEIMRSADQVERAQQAVARASSESTVRSAVKDAEAALKAARRAGAGREAKAALRDLERKLEQLRRDAGSKKTELDGQAWQQQNARAQAEAARYDNLARMSLGVVPPVMRVASGAVPSPPAAGPTRSPGPDPANGLPASGSSDQPGASDVIHTSSGEKGAWNPVLSDPPANATIVVDERIVYETDTLARTVRAQTVLSDVVRAELRAEAQRWLRHKGAQAGAGGEDRLKRADGGRDEGGHIFGVLFGGPGEAINLEAMDFTNNRVSYRELEKIWEQHVEDGGIVNVSVDFRFEGDSKRPSEFDVSFDLDDGRSLTIPFYQ